MILGVALSLRSAGYNWHGQLGLGDHENRLAFAEVKSLKTRDTKLVSQGQHHCFFLAANDTLYATGSNEKGQLGIGQAVKNVSELTMVEYFSDNNIKITQMAVGYHHSLVLGDDQTKLYSFGDNEHKQLGRSTIGKSDSLPGLVDLSNLDSDENITFITSRYYSSYLKTNKGNWYAWGYAYGMNIFPNHHKDTTIDIPTKMIMPFTVQKLYLGVYTIFITDLANNLFAMGNNLCGMMCQSTKINDDFDSFQKVDVQNVSKVVIGIFHSVILSDGVAYGCGIGSHGELGNATQKENNSVPLVISNDLGKVLDITATFRGIFLNTSQGLFATGENEYGQLGLNKITIAKSFTPVVYPSNTIPIKVISEGHEYSFLIDGVEETIIEEESIVEEEIVEEEPKKEIFGDLPSENNKTITIAYDNDDKIYRWKFKEIPKESQIIRLNISVISINGIQMCQENQLSEDCNLLMSIIGEYTSNLTKNDVPDGYCYFKFIQRLNILNIQVLQNNITNKFVTFNVNADIIDIVQSSMDLIIIIGSVVSVLVILLIIIIVVVVVCKKKKKSEQQPIKFIKKQREKDMKLASSNVLENGIIGSEISCLSKQQATRMDISVRSRRLPHSSGTVSKLTPMKNQQRQNRIPRKIVKIIPKQLNSGIQNDIISQQNDAQIDTNAHNVDLNSQQDLVLQNTVNEQNIWNKIRRINKSYERSQIKRIKIQKIDIARVLEANVDSQWINSMNSEDKVII